LHIWELNIALCLLRDILDLLDRTSKCFQKDNLDIQQLKNLINATKETIMSYRPRIVQPPTVEDMILLLLDQAATVLDLINY
jgi:hypothetical protein